MTVFDSGYDLLEKVASFILHKPVSESEMKRTREIEIKFECQLYKVRDGEYALDVQRLSGNLLQFMCLASELLYTIKI